MAISDERDASLRRLYSFLPSWFLRERITDLQRSVFGPVPARYEKFVQAERADAAHKIALLEAELARRPDREGDHGPGDTSQGGD